MNRASPNTEGTLPRLLPNSPNSRLMEQMQSNKVNSNFSSSPSTTTMSPQPIRASTTHRVLPAAVIAKIEDIFEAVADCILNCEKHLTIQLRPRQRNLSSDVFEYSRSDVTSEQAMRTVKFPSRSVAEARRFGKFKCWCILYSC